MKKFRAGAIVRTLPSLQVEQLKNICGVVLHEQPLDRGTRIRIVDNITISRLGKSVVVVPDDLLVEVPNVSPLR